MGFCKNIAVFCGSAEGVNPAYAMAARRLGELIGRQRRSLVFGGCLDGLMALVAEAARENGAPVYSEFIRSLYQDKDHLPEAHESFHENVFDRKRGLIERSDACIMLPGGFGTLDEFTEVCAAIQIGEASCRVGILNTAGYYDPLLAYFSRMRKEGFLAPEWDSLYAVASEPESLLEQLDETRQ